MLLFVHGNRQRFPVGDFAVFERVGDQFVEDQAQVRGRAHRQRDPAVARETEVLFGKAADDPVAERDEVVLHVDRFRGVIAIKDFVGFGDGGDALLQLCQLGDGLLLRRAVALEADDGQDKLEVVLDAVMQLFEEGLFFAHRSGELLRTQAHLFGDEAVLFGEQVAVALFVGEFLLFEKFETVHEGQHQQQRFEHGGDQDRFGKKVHDADQAQRVDDHQEIARHEHQPRGDEETGLLVAVAVDEDARGGVVEDVEKAGDDDDFGEVEPRGARDDDLGRDEVDEDAIAPVDRGEFPGFQERAGVERGGDDHDADLRHDGGVVDPGKPEGGMQRQEPEVGQLLKDQRRQVKSIEREAVVPGVSVHEKAEDPDGGQHPRQRDDQRVGMMVRGFERLCRAQAQPELQGRCRIADAKPVGLL